MTSHCTTLGLFVVASCPTFCLFTVTHVASNVIVISCCTTFLLIMTSRYTLSLAYSLGHHIVLQLVFLWPNIIKNNKNKLIYFTFSLFIGTSCCTAFCLLLCYILFSHWDTILHSILFIYYDIMFYCVFFVTLRYTKFCVFMFNNVIISIWSNK